MPRLERDGPELEVLGAIQRVVVPLFEKRISDASKNIDSLAVLNSLSFFLIEISQLLLWVRRGQELDDQEHEAFLGGLQPVLQLLEKSVEPQILGAVEQGEPPTGEGHQERDSVDTDVINAGVRLGDEPRYPKLQALIREGLQESTFVDLAKLIRLPEAKDDAEAADKTITDFNANNSARFVGDDAGPTRIRANQRSITFQHNHPCIRQSQLCSSMFKALACHFEASKCNSQRVAKLQVREPENDPNAGDIVQHKVFISSCTHENKWQEVNCVIVSEMPAPSSNLRDVTNICQSICSLDSEEILKVWVCSTCILQDEGYTEFTRSPPTWPNLSLADILGEGRYCFGRNERVVLAYNLARTLLRTYSTDMQQREWGSEDVYFLYEPERGIIHEAYNPYIAFTLLRPGTPGQERIRIPKKFPILVSFAKLLLEIGLGKAIVPVRRLDVHLITCAKSDETARDLVTGHFKAVMACLEAKKDQDEEDSVDEETQCRQVIYDVVDHLEKARKACFGLDPNHRREIEFAERTTSAGNIEREALRGTQNSLTLNQVLASIESPILPPAPSRQQRLSITDLRSLIPWASPSGLFDEQKLRLHDDEPRRISAEGFLDRACRFYECYIKGLSNRNSIRIAILDTGIDERNAFIKGVRWQRHSAECPIKQSETFVTGSKEDKCGHGTNVAGLILRIYPQADLYIAKIAQGLEENGVEHIVKAIKWAMGFGVHIINMSFSIPWNLEIKKAIKDAEHAGMIIFAAASNNGANSRRSFPASLDNVLCIHATDGGGNKSGMNPPPDLHRENLSTLGVAVPSIWEAGTHLSGTSYATPVAAAIAALVLVFIQDATAAKKMTEDLRDDAFSRDGMKNILLKMAVPNDGYSYIAPWTNFWPDSAEAYDVMRKIREALRGV